MSSTDGTFQINLLIVDDDEDLGKDTLQFLQENGFHVDHAIDVNSARRLIAKNHYDLYVLDLIMPGTSGRVLCREIRTASRAGIIMASSVSDDEERINLLQIGADDYIVKPFNPHELSARIHAILRRISIDAPRNVHSARFGPWQLVESDRHVKHEDGRVVSLTHSEAEVLRYFVSNPDVLCTREDLLAISRVRQHGGNSDRSVDVLMSRLRKKLESDPAHPEFFHTVWGRGYIFRSRA